MRWSGERRGVERRGREGGEEEGVEWEREEPAGNLDARWGRRGEDTKESTLHESEKTRRAGKREEKTQRGREASYVWIRRQKRRARRDCALKCSMTAPSKSPAAPTVTSQNPHIPPMVCLHLQPPSFGSLDLWTPRARIWP